LNTELGRLQEEQKQCVLAPDRMQECKRQIMNHQTGIGKIINYILYTESSFDIVWFENNCKTMFGINYNHSFFTIGKYTKYGHFLINNNNIVTLHPDYFTVFRSNLVD